MTNSSLSPDEAFQQLMAGNARYLGNTSTNSSRVDEQTRRTLAEGQAPYAAILTCADSRTPPEHIFDAGLGELLVCRNSGNLVDRGVLGSLEYAAVHLGTNLVAVMGHSRCGAVAATLSAALDPDSHESENIQAIMGQLMPAVAATRKDGQTREEWVNAAAMKNVKDATAGIVEYSPIITDRVKAGTFAVKALWYDLATGVVTEL
jgi:carbonic anhydrase